MNVHFFFRTPKLNSLEILLETLTTNYSQINDNVKLEKMNISNLKVVLTV